MSADLPSARVLAALNWIALVISGSGVCYTVQRDARGWWQRQRGGRWPVVTVDASDETFEVQFSPTITFADRSKLPKERLTGLDAQKVASPVIGRLLTPRIPEDGSPARYSPPRTSFSSIGRL